MLDRKSFPFPPWTWPLLAALLLGAWQRCQSLTLQVPAGDELHAIRSAVELSYGKLLTSFSTAATPLLAIYYKLIAEVWPLDELAIRLPMLLCGLLTPLLLPLYLPRFEETSDRRLRWLYGALLALSPVLVYYSRFARPYAPALLCATLALFAFYRWWLSEAEGWPKTFLLCAALAAALHATTVPAVFAPFLWATYDLWRHQPAHQPRSRLLRRLVVLGFLTAFLVALPLALPLFFDWQGLFYRAGQHHASLLTLRELLPLLAGSASWPLTLLLLALAALGSYRLLREAPRFAGCLLTTAALSLAATLLSGANSVHIPIVFLRYSLIVLPIFLLLVAAGLVLPLRERQRLATPLLALLPLLVYFGGPLPSLLRHVHSFSSHPHYQYSYREDSPFSFTRRPRNASSFYQELAKQPPGSLRIAEAPYHYEFTKNIFVYGQEVHQQWVAGGLLGEACTMKTALRLPAAEGKLAFRQLVDVSQKEALEKAGIDLVILHHRLALESAEAEEAGAFVPPPRITFGPVVENCLPRYVESLGQPIYQDPWVSVFAISGRFPAHAGT